MRGLGKGVKSFKEGMNEPLEEKTEEAKDEAAEPVHDAHFHGSLFGLARCVALYFGRAVPFHHACALREREETFGASGRHGLPAFHRRCADVVQENPDRSQDFQEPKTKIYETFYLQPFKRLQVQMIRTAAKIHKKIKAPTFFFKNQEKFDILDKYSTKY